MTKIATLYLKSFFSPLPKNQSLRLIGAIATDIILSKNRVTLNFC
jgi:hypothetical protein